MERAVAAALLETVGAEEARALENQLLSDYPPPFRMPRSIVTSGLASGSPVGCRTRPATEPRSVYGLSGGLMKTQRGLVNCGGTDPLARQQW